MSKRRQTGDWVWLNPLRNDVPRWKQHYRIISREPSFSCSFNAYRLPGGCVDPDCKQWHELLSDANPITGTRQLIRNVCECEMFDEPQV